MNRTIFLASLMSSTALMGFPSTPAYAADNLTVDDSEVRTIEEQLEFDDVDVGLSDGSDATLNIQNGGSVSSESGNLGLYARSKGTMTVTGEGSTWTNPGDLSIGVYGDGTLTISDRGSVSSVDAFIGTYSNSTGEVTVTGEGSTWTNSDRLSVGYNNDGTLTISDGGSVSSGTGFIGRQSGGTGIVTVTGGGSTWTNSNSLSVGLDGDGSLTISDGGSVTAGSKDATTGAYDGDVAIAANSGSTGTLVIGAAAGETAVAAGSLEAASVSFGEGTGKIVFNHTDSDYEFAAGISGDGAIDVDSGTSTLSGDSSSFTGTTTVDDATLLVTGTLGGTLDINDDGIIGGTGTIGSTILASGSTVSPGVSGATGTLTVSGDLILNSGSIYAVDVTASAADLISVTGTADVSGGKVSVTSLDAKTSYQTSQTYTILTADTVTGSFADTVSKSAFMDVATETINDAVKLTVSINSNPDNGSGSGVFTAVAKTSNQHAVAGALDTLEQSGNSLSLYNSMLVLSAEEARKAFEQMSGDAYAGQQAGMLQSSGALNATLNSRLRSNLGGGGLSSGLTTGSVPVLGYAEEKPSDPNSPFAFYEAKKTARIADPDRLAIWGSGFGSWGSSDGLDGASGTDTSTGGFLIGADGMITETWRAGIFAGHSASKFDADDSNADSDNYHVGAYAGTEIGQLSIRSGLSYSWYDVDTTRVVSALGQTLDGSYDATSLNAFGELGYRFDLSGSAFEPFAGIAYTHLKTQGFSESGGTAALTVDGSTMDTTYTTLGMRASRTLDLGGVVTVARGTLGWQHAYGDVNPTSTARFETGGSFTVSNTPIDSNVALVEVGLDFLIDNGATLGIGYSGQFGKHATENGFNAKLRVQF